MDTILQASCIDHCPHLREKEKGQTEKIFPAIAFCMGGSAVARTGVLPVRGAELVTSATSGTQPPCTHVRGCHCELQQERVQTSFLQSSGKARDHRATLRTSVTMGKDVRCLEMPDKCVCEGCWDHRFLPTNCCGLGNNFTLKTSV